MVDMTKVPGSRLPNPQQQNRAQTSWQGKATGVTGGGMTRVSPGVYRNPQGGLQVGTTPVPTAKPPAAKKPPMAKTPPPVTAQPPATTQPPVTTMTPEQQQAALSGYQGYRLPTQEELSQMFQKRYEQELADITFGAGERQARERASREQQLANMGISIDSESYRAEQRALAESQALEAAQARQQARQFAEGAIGAEFNRATQAQQLGFEQQRLQMEQQQLTESVRQFDKNYALTEKKALADIARDKNLTALEKVKVNELMRSNRAQEALELKKIAAMRAGDQDSAQRAADQQAYLWKGELEFLMDPVQGWGLTREEAIKEQKRRMRGGPSGLSYSIG